MSDKDSSGFAEENRRAVAKLNLVVASACLIFNLVSILIIDPHDFSRISSALLYARIPMIAASLLALACAFLPWLSRFSIPIADMLVLFIFLFAARFMLEDPSEPLMINSWILFVVLGVGIFPIPLAHSLAVFACACAFFSASYLSQGSLWDRFMQLFVVNSVIAVAVAAPVKYFFFAARKAEFIARGRLEAANREISGLYERLKSLDALKSDFIANISHELRTPLTLIISPIEAFLDGSLRVEDQRAFLEGLDSNAKRLKGLVDDILDFSKIDSGKMELCLREVDVGAILRSIVEGFRLAALAKGDSLELVDSLHEGGHRVDVPKFEKILFNLLSNAMKYTGKGGAIRVEAREDGESWQVSVSDTGPGIRSDLVEVVFERFRRAEVDSNDSPGGSGIGLALARELAEMQGGQILLRSRYIGDSPEDHGCEFILRMPASPAGALPGIARTEAAEERTLAVSADVAGIQSRRVDPVFSDERERKPHLLVVEDNPEMGSFLLSLLGLSFAADLAEGGTEALSLLASGDYDIVLTDVMMPGLDGLELARRLRADSRLSSLPIVMLSARADVPTRLDGLDSGAVDYIVKPFDSRELVARLKSQAHLKLLRDQVAAATAEGAREKRLTEETSTKLNLALDFMRKNYQDDISRESLARSLELSPDHFGRMFRRLTGKKVVEYLAELRLERASQELLNSSAPITEIALDSGFESLRTFNRAFKLKYGKNPSEFREACE
jgi:signal transduction histidine kinase/DNA-binding response OmpR family regulator